MENKLSKIFGSFGAVGEVLQALTDEIATRIDLNEDEKDARLSALKELYARLEVAQVVEVLKREEDKAEWDSHVDDMASAYFD